MLGLGGSRYHTSIHNVKLGSCMMANTGVAMMPDGGNKKDAFMNSLNVG